eukprot:4302589-Pleurochrysis_carterae.AAC.2
MLSSCCVASRHLRTLRVDPLPAEREHTPLLLAQLLGAQRLQLPHARTRTHTHAHAHTGAREQGASAGAGAGVVLCVSATTST